MGVDMFSTSARAWQRPWEDGTDSVDMALKRVGVLFEFCQKLGAPFYAFHDRDVAPEGRTLTETNKNLDRVVKELKQRQRDTGIGLLWGTAGCSSSALHARRPTSCNRTSLRSGRAGEEGHRGHARARGAPVTLFWGGREGYSTLLNTDMKREMDHLGAFLHLAVDWKKELGFKASSTSSPSPRTTKHQYDRMRGVPELPSAI